jgi:hypothetical protein
MKAKKAVSKPTKSTQKNITALIRQAAQATLDEEAGRAEAAARTPSLSSVKSEYRRFCDSTRGPINIHGFEAVTKATYEGCCEDFPLIRFTPIIERWQADATTGIRHWPAMAYAVNDYRFRQKEFAGYGKPPSESDIRESLSTIGRSARELHAALTRLQASAHQLSDGAAPRAIPHLAWIDQYIAQAAAGIVSKDLVEEPTTVAIVFFERTKFLERIMGVDAASTVSINRLDTSLLKRPSRTPENRALRRLVSMAKPIWKSLTGRPPSTNKSVRKGGEGVPDFVLFVQAISEIAGGPFPSFKQVATAARPRRTP